MKNKIKKNDKVISIPLLMLLGISEDEAFTLYTIISKKPKTVHDLARTLKLSRNTVYGHLKALTKQGLLNETNSNPITSIDPHLILTRVTELLRLAEESFLDTVANATHKNKPETQVHEGENSVSSLYDDIALSLPRGGTYFRYTSRKADTKRSGIYRELRKKKELERLVITSIEKAHKKQEDPNRFIKTIPKEFAFDDNVTLVIYADKIAHIDHNTNTTITITSKPLARFQEKIFKILWRKL